MIDAPGVRRDYMSMTLKVVDDLVEELCLGMNGSYAADDSDPRPAA